MQHVDQETLDTLACELDQRPRGAPSFADVATALRSVTTADGVLVAEYDASATADVVALAAAERLCCADIGWEVERGDPVRLRITATAKQVAALAQMVRDA